MRSVCVNEQSFNLPDVFEDLARIGMDSKPTSAPEMQQKIAAELDLWGKVVKVPGFQWQ